MPTSRLRREAGIFERFDDARLMVVEGSFRNVFLACGGVIVSVAHHCVGVCGAE